MYVTRPLSHYRKSPGYLSEQPDGPNSGYLVLQDEESETTTCFGLCKNRYLIDLPFPQNKNLTLVSGSDDNVSQDDATFIPVVNLPLSSNRYYAIKPHGSRKGQAYACSKEEDMGTCCFCKYIKDAYPRPLEPNDIYQQFEIVPYEITCKSGGTFCAKSVAPDGFPPNFLRKKGWEIYTKTPKNYELGEALGINTALRASLPELNFSTVVGKWYCPFMFIKEGALGLGDQMKKTMFYEMTLERRWEQIFTCKKDLGQGNSVSLEVEVQREVVLIGDREAVWDETEMGGGGGGGGGMIWFRSVGGGGEVNIGLSTLIVDRIKWEQERVGRVGGGERQVRVKRTEEFEGGVMGGGWNRFGCYVLVERFVLKRMDGSVVLNYDFKHTHLLRTKWE